MQNFRGAPVHGFICRKDDGTYQMVVTLRGAFADIFWFSLFHELGHIVNGDVDKSGIFVDAAHSRNQKRENAADTFASNALLNPSDYQAFIADTTTFSYTQISEFAKKQNVPSYIVIGRLQKEERVPWTWFNKYKLRYKWAQ